MVKYQRNAPNNNQLKKTKLFLRLFIFFVAIYNIKSHNKCFLYFIPSPDMFVFFTTCFQDVQQLFSFPSTLHIPTKWVIVIYGHWNKYQIMHFWAIISENIYLHTFIIIWSYLNINYHKCILNTLLLTACSLLSRFKNLGHTHFSHIYFFCFVYQSSGFSS